MNNLIRMERYKLFHNIVFWIFLIGMTALGFYSGKDYRVEYWAHTVTGVSVNSFSGVFNSMVADSVIFMVAVSSLLGWFIGREFSNRTLSMEVASGHSRRDIYLSKVIVNLTAYNIVMILYPLAGAISQIGYFGTGDLLNNILNILRTSVYMFLLQTAFFSVTVMIAFLLRSGVKTAVVAPVASFVLAMIFAVFMTKELPMGVLFVDPIYRLREITSMGSTLAWPGIINIPAILSSIVWTGGCSIIILKNFKRSELK
ncbi:MAG: ABC transporter permease subunit [Clostridiales bacterium]|nr:ABC transporter permease subunit [Clostridiales bacterium]